MDELATALSVTFTRDGSKIVAGYDMVCVGVDSVCCGYCDC